MNTIDWVDVRRGVDGTIAMAAISSLQGIPAVDLLRNSIMKRAPAAVILALRVRRGHVMQDAFRHTRGCSIRN